MITDIVGSLVRSQGIIPKSAKIRKYVSIFLILLNPYFRENKNIISVNTSAHPVGIAPTPAPPAI